jgi:hypothetical protein
MKDSESKLSSSKDGKNQLEWDLETITEQILSDLDGAFTPSKVQEVLKEVATNYEDARVQSFVPIFIRRDVVKRLREMQAPIVSPVLIEAADNQANSDPTSATNDDGELDTANDSGLIRLEPVL